MYTRPIRRITDAEWEQILVQCVTVGTCLIWQGYTHCEGYALIILDGKIYRLHRVVYTYFKGPIPPGLTIDHVATCGCQSKACISIDHLEAVTNRVNILRGNGVAGRNARQTHCKRGHPLTSENLIQYRTGRMRTCRLCSNLRYHLRRQRLGVVA